MTPKERAAMQQALDALENAYENGFLTGITGLKTIDIITALREALAEPELNLNCKSVQKRLATVWGYVKAEQAEQELVIECDCETSISSDGSRLTKCGSDQMRRAVEQGHAFCKQQAEQEPVALNIASQCRATASSEFAKNCLVDGGSGTLQELLLDAANAIENAAPVQQAEQEPSIDFDKLHEMNMQYVECPACGSDMAMAYSPKNQAEQEPVAWVDLEQWQSGEYDCFTSEKVADYMTPLYTAPVRKKDLTDDDIQKLRYKLDLTAEWSYVNFARAVIAADREKNK